MTSTTGENEKDVEVFSLQPQQKHIFEATNLDDIFTWVDVSYSVHHDMKSQNRGMLSMGLGVTHCRSSKKKLNTNISTDL